MNVRHLLYILFTISGFAGLIYESIWSHYLKLILGHAAYAQTLVLSLFMGGMALGAWLCGRVSEQIRYPLMGYAIVEFALGVFALTFDPLFRFVSALLLENILPALAQPWMVDLYKWGLAALMILPPCILLGATFPLISAGVFRLDPRLAGRTLGWLYFTNSIGAVFGVLTSGMLLIRLVGLPGTLLTAGLLNFALAMCVWFISRTGHEHPPVSVSRNASQSTAPALLLAVTFGSSAASFCYEIGWIRMLSLVLGSATHSFELMLAAFILGLALGALFIRNRIDALTQPLGVLAAVQIAMGVFALATLALYEQSFGWMAAVMRGLAATNSGYVWYLFSSAGISMAIMLPAAICAGMTLPLITASLLHAGHGESSIGRVYAANTLGAIVGVLLAVHVLMPVFGVRQVIAVGGVVDLAIGLWLWYRYVGRTGWAGRAMLGGALGCAAVFLCWRPFDQSLLSSGVFRYGGISSGHEVVYHRDGKTATVHVYAPGNDILSIATNGKVDAALNPGKATGDDYTMILTAALPLSMKPDAQDIAVIGFGSGRSTHTFLQSPTVRSVDTIEIERAMVEGARQFGSQVAAAYEDPRSRIHIEDAKTWFARGNRQFDVISSEPSNPWVSGVASLFTAEFYAQIKRYLKPGGLFVQWLQTYETDLTILSSVVGALGSEFDDYAIYVANSSDLIIVAAVGAAIPIPGGALLDVPAMASLLDFIKVDSADALRLRLIGHKALIADWLDGYGAPLNSDYFPFVDQHAAQARFRRQHADEHLHAIQPFAWRLGGLSLPERPVNDRESGVWGLARSTLGRSAIRAGAWLAGVQGYPEGDAPHPQDLATVVQLLSIRQHCRGPEIGQMWLPALLGFIGEYGPYLRPDEAADFSAALRRNACHGELGDHVALWLDFFDAVVNRNYTEVRNIGTTLIEEERAARRKLHGGLVYEVLLADLMVAGSGAMRTRARSLGSELPPGTVHDFLLAQERQVLAAQD